MLLLFRINSLSLRDLLYYFLYFFLLKKLKSHQNIRYRTRTQHNTDERFLDFEEGVSRLKLVGWFALVTQFLFQLFLDEYWYKNVKLRARNVKFGKWLAKTHAW